MMCSAAQCSCRLCGTAASKYASGSPSCRRAVMWRGWRRWETGYWGSMDIMHDRAGYYICWGCLVRSPALPPVCSSLCPPAALVVVWILIVSVLCEAVSVAASVLLRFGSTVYELRLLCPSWFATHPLACSSSASCVVLVHSMTCVAMPSKLFWVAVAVVA